MGFGLPICPSFIDHSQFEGSNSPEHSQQHLANRGAFVAAKGKLLFNSGADVQMSFVEQMAIKVKGREAVSHSVRYVGRIEERPGGYQRAVSKHGV